MIHTTLELIFNSSFTFSIPVWIVFIAVIFAFYLLYWDKNLSRLRINGKPEPFNISYDAFEVQWKRPTFARPSSYIVYVRNVSEPERWNIFNTRNGECSKKIFDLSPNTKYVVCVCACSGTETGPVGCESDVITTKNLAFKLKQESTLLSSDLDIPYLLPMYAVKYESKEDNNKKIRRIIIGDVLEDGCIQNGKSILVFSAPHSGKTTLLQGIMNFIFGVSSSDDYRLSFAPELTSKDILYHDWVTVYEFQEYKGGRIGYPFTIIDVPRSHLSGKEDILKLRDQISSYQTEFDCICFVTQANMFSLPAEQIEYMQSINYLFQSAFDAEMCCCFFTFADLGPAPVKRVFEVNDIRVSESFLVNCSSLFQQIDSASKFFWESNFRCLQRFFEHLQTSVQTFLLGNVDSDFSTLNKLLSQIEDLHPEMNEELAKLGEIKYETETLIANQDEILSTGDFKFQIKEIKQIKEDLEPGRHVTNCMLCFKTCHEDCRIPDDAGKKECVAMDSDGYCKKCTDHCIWNVHKNTPYIYSYKEVQVTKSYKEMRTSYEKENGKQLDFNEYLDHLNRDIEALLERLHDKVTRLTDCTNEVRGIKKSQLGGSIDDKIDDMIKSERERKDKGYERRIEMFLELKNYNEMIKINKN